MKTQLNFQSVTRVSGFIFSLFLSFISDQSFGGDIFDQNPDTYHTATALCGEGHFIVPPTDLRALVTGTTTVVENATIEKLSDRRVRLTFNHSFPRWDIVAPDFQILFGGHDYPEFTVIALPSGGAPSLAELILGQAQ